MSEKKNFEEGVLNKFFKLNINNQSPFCYVSEAKKNPLNKTHKPALYIRGRKTKSRV